MRSGGEGVRVTRTPEDPKVVVARRGYRRERGVEWEQEKQWTEGG